MHIFQHTPASSVKHIHSQHRFIWTIHIHTHSPSHSKCTTRPLKETHTNTRTHTLKHLPLLPANYVTMLIPRQRIKIALRLWMPVLMLRIVVAHTLVMYYCNIAQKLFNLFSFFLDKLCCCWRDSLLVGCELVGESLVPDSCFFSFRNMLMVFT